MCMLYDVWTGERYYGLTWLGLIELNKHDVFYHDCIQSNRLIVRKAASPSEKMVSFEIIEAF